MSPLDIRLADLIARLDHELADVDDLTRISEAQLRVGTLADLGEQLVGHYVDQAKRAGASWSQIGDALGVSKQAVQQRHTPGAFDRFTTLSRHSIVLAQEAARTHRHELIGTEHLLLGLIGEPQGLAYAILTAAGGTEQRVRDAVDEVIAPPGRKALRGHIAFGPDARSAIEQAGRAASELGHDWVGTEHLLLGLSRVPGVAGQVLAALGCDGLAEAVRTHPDLQP